VVVTCADYQVPIDPEVMPDFPALLTLFDQHLVAAASAGGDSGSPVFAKGSYSNVKLHGLLWGGDGNYFAFSDLSSIEEELGTLTHIPWGNLDPVVTITEPDEGENLGPGAFFNVTLRARYFDPDPRPQDQPIVSWKSSRDGALGQSPVLNGIATLPVTLSGRGQRTITAIGLDGTSGIATDSVTVTTENSLPDVRITSPASGATVHRGAFVPLAQETFDMESFAPLVCSALVWESDRPGDPFPITGCNPVVTFTTLGSRIITLTGTDPDGRSATDVIEVHVINPPASSPPSVKINMTQNLLLQPNAQIFINGTADDPDDAGAISYQWVLEYGATVKTLKNDSSPDGGLTYLAFRPSDHMPRGCGPRAAKLHLIATDADGQVSSFTVHFEVFYTPC
jgi:hypothetical protein